MIGLILKKISVSGKTDFLHKIAYGLGLDISCIKFLVVIDFKVISNNIKEVDILNRCGLL